jgi:T-complex protein 1 subunit eta
VVVLAGEILKEIREHVEQGVSSQIIIKGLRRASAMAVNKVKEIAVRTDEANRRETLSKLAGTAMTSKLIKRNTEFFTKSRFWSCYFPRPSCLQTSSGGRRRPLLRPG